MMLSHVCCTLLFAIPTLLDAQITFSNSVPTELTICGDAKTFTVSFTNTGATSLYTVKCQIVFPSGIAYVPGSVSGGSATEFSTTNLSSVTFSLPQILPGGSNSFTVQGVAEYAALTAAQAGTVFRNTVNVTHSAGSASATTIAWNMLYPALSITSAPDASAYVGQTFTRAVTIVNGGFGALSSFTLTDSYDSNLDLLSVNKGTLNGAETIITFDAADFAGIGDGDGLFENNETLVLTETIKAIGCTSSQSTLTAKWGCDGSLAESNKKYPKTTISLYAPTLVFTPTASFSTCISATGDNQVLQIQNTGTGPAKSTSVVIAAGATDLYTRVDVSSITWQIGTGGTPVSLTPTATTAAFAHACFPASPKAGFTITLPDIDPGQIILLKWKTYTCATTACGAVNLIGWTYNSSYTNMCNSQTYTKNGTGQALKKKNVTMFVENPGDLIDGQTGEYVFTLTSAVFDMPQGTNRYFQAEFDVPPGLDWSGTASDLTFKNGASAWSPSSTTYDSGTRRLTAKYPLPIPITLAYSEIRVRLTANCTGLTGISSVNLGFALYYVMDGGCTAPHKFSLTCFSSPLTQIHCPGGSCVGMEFQGFTPKRFSKGSPDNNQDGIADGSGSLDLTKILLNRVMSSDTFQTTFTGTVHTDGSYPAWSYAFAKSTMGRGSSVTALWATLTVTDISTGTTKTATLSTYANSVSGGLRTTTWNLSPASIGGSFAGFTYGDGDLVTLTAHYQLSGNIGTTMEQINFTNEFYTSTALTGGTKFQCNSWLGNLTVMGYSLSNYSSEQYNVEECTKQINQNFGLFIGQSAVAGGMDMFPFEYRSWAIVRDLQVTMPAGYSYVSSGMSQARTISGNSTTTQSVSSISPTATSGQVLTFNLETNYTTSGGSLLWSDDGFNGTVNVTIRPTCSVSTADNPSMPWQFTFKKSGPLGGTTTSWVTATADRVKYKPAVITFTSTAQTAGSLTPVVSWNVDLKNSSGTPAYNSWFHLESPSGKLQITQVTNRNTSAVITPDANGFYRMGTTAANATMKIRVSATYTNCSIDQINIVSGYSCDGYPTDFASLPCPVQSWQIYNDPQPSELQVKMTSSLDPGSDCANRVNVEIEMLGSKLGATTDIEVRITPPANGHIVLENGTTQYKYPAAGSYTSFTTPTLTGGKQSIFLENLVSSLETTGLPGVTSTTSNLFKVKFSMTLTNNYRPGDLAGIQIFSKKACGASNAASSFDFDPGAVFIKKTNIGLDGPLDAWSASWVDYDGDGDPDIFIGTATATDPNVLFRNNGNGTFTKITTGTLVTENSKSYASTWADVDNDGDPDGFISTDVGQKKLFFKNNGDGTFTKMTSGAPVDELGYARGAAWADYDNDGWVDLFVADFFKTKFNLLFHNNGDGTFTKITDGPIATEAASSVSGAWGDYNNDGLVDLFVANTNDENNSLYKNLGGGRFEKITSGVVVNDGGKSVGASWGDIDNDGDLDLFVANGGQQAHFLYENNGDGSFSRITTGDAALDAGYSNGSSFVDYDNDGDLDLFVANDQLQNNSLYSNDGAGDFRRISGSLTQDGGQSFGTAWADYDNDGDMDALVANRSGGDLFFYENGRGQCNTFLCLKLVGSKSNRSAIGAKIRVKASVYGETTWQMRQISAQTGGGVGGQDEMKALFGLGQDGSLDTVVIEWPSGFRQVLTASDVSLNTFQTITEPNATRVCGHVWLDLDSDCGQDGGEPGIRNTRIRIEPGGFYTATDAAGDYEVFLANGNYTLTALPETGYSLECPTANSGTRQVTVSSLGQNLCGNDFGVSSSCANPDLDIEVTATTLRVGFKNLVAINYRNRGTQTATSLSLTVDFGNDLQPLSASQEWTGEEGTARIWSLPDLELGATGTIYATVLVPSGTQLDKQVELDAEVVCLEPECNASNNSFLMTQRTVGAVDPNDILVSPEGGIRTGQVLSYKIRFQNVGTFLAKRVVVDDILPDGLDLSTLVFGAASHPYRLQVSDDGRHLTWIFDNINLADSTTNEPESHGFVTFKIRPLADLPAATELPNSAEIRFDAQPPIRTNTVLNFIKNNAATFVLPGQVALVPNPASGQVRVFLPDSNEKMERVEVFDLRGQRVWSATNPEELPDVEIPLGDWQTGSYFVRAFSANGRVRTGKLLVQH